MTSGKQSFDQNSEDTKTIEDRDYFVIGKNIFNRANAYFLRQQLGMKDSMIEQMQQFPAKVDPYWIDQLREGYVQWKVSITRDREVLSANQEPRLQLYYNQSSPYCWWFGGKSELVVITLAKDKEQAEKHANKVLTQQYLNPKWLAMKENDVYFSKIY